MLIGTDIKRTGYVPKSFTEDWKNNDKIQIVVLKHTFDICENDPYIDYRVEFYLHYRNSFFETTLLRSLTTIAESNL